MEEGRRGTFDGKDLWGDEGEKRFGRWGGGCLKFMRASSHK